MNIVHLLETKRDGGTLSTAEISWFVEGVSRGTIPDYQIAPLLMAIAINGMGRRETVDLTLAMAKSGDTLDLHDVAPFIVDKHSSGGVGDKTTLVVQPLVAACGVPVGKMSGRGLGSSGGTLDKMESIKGWRFNLTLPEFKRQLSDIGLVLGGQTAALAPADGKLYALRDVTGTVPSLPLIASSIMSKKLAAGADAILLDVKVGNGSFMPTVEKGRELAEVMVKIGVDAGRKTIALLSDMNQPLGHAIGNVLELREAIDTLHGHNPPPDFWAHCLAVAGQMLLLAGKVDTIEQAHTMLTNVRDNGTAWQTFRQMVIAQDGDVAQVDDPNKLPQAKYQKAVVAPRAGTIAGILTNKIGWASVDLGAGRRVKTDEIDHAVGLIMPAKVGNSYQKGDILATIHANDMVKLATAETEILGAIEWSDVEMPALPHDYGIVG